MDDRIQRFDKGQQVIKILVGLGVRTCSGPYTIATIEDHRVRIGDSSIEYDAATGVEVASVIPGMHAEIVLYEGGL